MPGFQTPSVAASVIPKSKDTQGFFEDFDAAELYCPQCEQAVPVIKGLGKK